MAAHDVLNDFSLFGVRKDRVQVLHDESTRVRASLPNPPFIQPHNTLNCHNTYAAVTYYSMLII